MQASRPDPQQSLAAWPARRLRQGTGLARGTIGLITGTSLAVAWPAVAQQAVPVEPAPAASQAPSQVQPQGPTQTQAGQRYDIAPGPLSQVLPRFASVAGVDLSADADLTRGLHSDGLRGEYTVEGGFTALLKGSRLEVAPQGAGRFILRPIRAMSSTPAAAVSAAGPADGAATALAPVRVSASTLGEITEGTGRYTTGATRAATRMPLTLRETPQSVTVLTSQQLEDRGTTGLAQALESVTGVHVTSDMARPSVYSRGLYVSNLQVDGNPQFPSGQALTAIQSDHMVIHDRIEVLRGANGLLTGPGDPSGTITLVRKRATRDFQAHVQGSVGSWSNWSGEADVAGPLTEGGRVRGRLATGVYDGHYFIKGKGRDGKALLATLEVDLTPHTVARIGYTHDEYTYEGMTGATTVPLWYSDGTPFNAPRSMSNTPRQLEFDHRTRNLYAGLEHSFRNGWAFQGLVDHSRRDMIYVQPMILLNAPDYPNPSGLGAAMGSYTPYPTDDRQLAYNFDFQGPLNLFGREHRLMIGASGWDRRRQVREWALDLSGMPPQSYADNMPLADLPLGIAYPYELTGHPRSRGFTEQHGAFAAARWNLADSFKLITGLRVTNWKTYTELYNGFTGELRNANSGAYAVHREITPYLGAVWDFRPDLSAYASYADVFQPQGLYDANDNLLKPVVGRNYEAGVKGEFLDRRLQASAAFFYLVQDNLGERAPGFPTDYLTPGGNTPYRSAGKGITTRGIETEITGSPRPGWNLYAGYTYARSENADGEAFDRNQPEHLFRLFSTWQLPGEWSKLTLGAGATWNSEISQTLQRPTGAYQADGKPVTADHEFRQGSVLRVNAMARYHFSPKLSLMFNADNLFDRKYYSHIASWGSPVAYYGQPRRLRASLRYQF